MMNLLYEAFPDCIEADGERLCILTDFREWIRYSDMLGDSDLTAEEKAVLLADWLPEYEGYITEAIVNALHAFYKADELEPDPLHEEDEEEEEAEAPPPSPPVFSWSIDAKFILGDFRRYYGIDLLAVDYMHWWKFKSLLAALPDESQCQKRIAYRSVNLSSIKDPVERERIRKIQQRIALPYECDDEMIGAVFGCMM